MRKLGSRGGASAMMRILGEKSGGESRGSEPGKTFETGVGRRRVEKGCAPEEKRSAMKIAGWIPGETSDVEVARDAIAS
jgi:hypothetical protein